MRIHLLGLILLAGAASPALAQRDPVERRIDRLEQEMRAVQRRIFPGGTAQFVDPEIRPETPAQTGPAATGGAIASLTARVDALEAQLAAITGQTEENTHRLRQLDQQVSRLRTDTIARLDRLEQARVQAPAQPAPAAAEPAPAPAAAETPPAAAPESAEAAYNAGFRLWEQRRYAEAAEALEAVARQHPNSRWASWARNLHGRALLDDDKPANAARVFLANYQDNPRGERAADSLFFLGQALARLDRRPQACQAYDELEQVYPNMRDFLRQRLPQARADARCGAAN